MTDFPILDDEHKDERSEGVYLVDKGCHDGEHWKTTIERTDQGWYECHWESGKIEDLDYWFIASGGMISNDTLAKIAELNNE